MKQMGIHVLHDVTVDQTLVGHSKAGNAKKIPIHTELGRIT